MAISKTSFINYTKCPRFYHLEELRKDKLTSGLTLEEYKKEEQNEELKTLVSGMFEETEEGDVDLTVKEDIQLNALRDIYTEIEQLAGLQSIKLFGGNSLYGESINEQACFEFNLHGIKYVCYVDVLNETEDEINIIEVKATTSRTFASIEVGKEKEPFFIMEKGIMRVNPYLDPIEKEKVANKFYDRYGKGKYVYDLSVQRYYVEKNNPTKKINYYLAVLDHEYIYDGYMEDGKRVYRTDAEGHDIVRLFDMNDITKHMQSIIDNDRVMLENNIFNGDESPCAFGKWCGVSKNDTCKYKEICWKNIPHYNASYNYKDFRGFKDGLGVKYEKYDLLNNGYYKLDDVPIEWLRNKKHLIQRECYDEDKVYVNKDKLKEALDALEYPIYHLDFESFPCPLPRFKGEKCYVQSVFEFSLHIESAPGVCDKEKDNFVFLAASLEDERYELTKALVEKIPILRTGGSMLAQNVSFEKGRIKELASYYPEYKKELMAIYDNATDLLYIINTNAKFYEELGYSKEEAGIFNYYNSLQSGSYSIKKTLPLFTDLKYSDLEVQNGTEALVEYSKYDKMSSKELEETRNNLTEYCKQDTWAMVEILRGLRKLVK